MRRMLFWVFLVGLAAVCLCWFSTLVVRAARERRVRWGAARARAERAADAQGDICIGVALSGNDDDGGKWEGLALARDQINGSGGINGRRVKLIRRQDGGTVCGARQLAQEFADDLETVAVIGHSSSRTTVPTAFVYEYFGVLLFAPSASSPELTGHGYNLVFRNTRSDAHVGVALAEAASRNGWRRLAIYYVRDEYGLGLANAFENRARELGLQVLQRSSYDDGGDPGNHRRMLERWEESLQMDALLVAGSVQGTASIVRAAREAGIMVPVLTGDTAATSDFVDRAGRSAEGVLAPFMMPQEGEAAETDQFLEAYRDRYGTEPDVYAALSYDTLMVLAHAMRLAGSTVPAKAADALRSVSEWRGATGTHAFTDTGDCVKAVQLRVVRNGAFEPAGAGQPGQGSGQREESRAE